MQEFYKAIDAAREALRKESTRVPTDAATQAPIDAADSVLTEAEEEAARVTEGREVLDGTCALRWYDDGYGKLWVYGESIGARGVVRAPTWEAAWEVTINEIMDEATYAEMIDDCGLTAEEVQELEDGGELPEGYYHRDGGELSSWDLNGSSLDLLTPELAESLGLTVNVRYEVK